MNLIRFAMEAGRRLAMSRDGDDDETGGGDLGAGSASLGVGGGARNSQAIRREISELGLNMDRIDIHVRGERVRMTGQAASQAEKEKILLLVGNVEGVGEVEDDITVDVEDEPSDFYTVEKGDTLYSIAKRKYGKGTEYKDIFEANRPMLKDPDRIYPGQKLRIPRKRPAGGAKS